MSLGDSARDTIGERQASQKVPTYPVKKEDQKPIGDGAGKPTSYKPAPDSQPESVPRAGGS